MGDNMKFKFMILPALAALIMTASAEDITVGLFYGGSAKQEVSVMSGDGLAAGGNPLGNSAIAKYDGGMVKIYDESGQNILTEGNEIEVTAGGNILKIDGKRYRGSALLRGNGSGIDVINKVDIEKYLYGVVPKESYASWDIEALKAQAVVARSLVFSSFMNKHVSQGFQLCATTNCQVYGGYDAETEKTNRAVDETAGIVVKYDGKIAQTLYSAGNGGYTESSENVWGGSYPYLQSFKDPYEETDSVKGLTWEVKVTPAEIAEGIAKYGGNVGEVTGMAATKTAPSGRITELTVYGTNGTYTLTNEKTRTFLGLRSQMYTIAGGVNLKALDWDGELLAAGTRVIGADGEISNISMPYIMDVGGVTEVSGGGEYVLTGRGYGHGVGMSQWGASAMASKGMTFEQILNFYFPGTQTEAY